MPLQDGIAGWHPAMQRHCRHSEATWSFEGMRRRPSKARCVRRRLADGGRDSLVTFVPLTGHGDLLFQEEQPCNSAALQTVLPEMPCTPAMPRHCDLGTAAAAAALQDGIAGSVQLLCRRLAAAMLAWQALHCRPCTAGPARRAGTPSTPAAPTLGHPGTRGVGVLITPPSKSSAPTARHQACPGTPSTHRTHSTPRTPIPGPPMAGQ